jgi:vancomycin resistance protein VanJ
MDQKPQSTGACKIDSLGPRAKGDEYQPAGRDVCATASGPGTGGVGASRPSRRSLAGTMPAAACWAYLALTLGVWAFIATTGDRLWFGTLLLFGPRWVWATPMVVLVPVAVRARHRPVGSVLLSASVVVVGPIMGLCLPWRAWLDGRPAAFSVRVLTLNTQLGSVRPGDLAALVAEIRPDIVALQEQSAFPGPRGSWGDGWHVIEDGDLCLISRFPIEATEFIKGLVPGGHGNAMRATLKTPAGCIAFHNVHLETPRWGLLAMIHGRRLRPGGVAALEQSIAIRAEESRRVSGWVAGAAATVLVAGDFNLTGDSAIFRDCWSGYTDAFAEAGLGFGHTEFVKAWASVPIDHILGGPGWRPRRCWVGPDVGSDHRPVIAEMDWVGFDD